MNITNTEGIMCVINIIVMILMIIGALNWGMIGFFNYDVISAIFGGMPQANVGGIARFIYAIVGLAGLWGLSFLGKLKCLCGHCSHHHKK